MTDSVIQDPEATTVDVPMVDVESSWWGFKIVLNQLGAKAITEILGELEQKLRKHIKNPEVRAAICSLLKVKEVRIGRVADRTGNGAKLVSPWLMPFSLVVVGEKAQNQSLWYAVWNDGATSDAEKWSVDTEFNDTLSFFGPALAQHGDLLYCVHRGGENDHSLWWCVYKTKNNTNETDADSGGWSSDHKFGHNNSTATQPAIAELNGTLYCFHRGNNQVTDDCNLWMCQLNADGTDWSADVKVADHTSTSGFAATVFNGAIHLVYEGGNGTSSDHKIRHVSWNGSSWSQVTVLENHLTRDVPGLAVYNNRLHMVHRGWNDEALWHCTSEDGIHWTADSALPDHFSEQGPALATYNGLLYMVHRSRNNSAKNADLWWATYDGSGWSRDTIFNDHKTADNPALAVYRDPQATVDANVDPNSPPLDHQLICVHRGA